MVTQDLVKRLFDYNEDTGVITWKEVRSKKVKIGQEAGYLSTDSGYRKITVGEKLLYAHRIAFLYTYGFLPKYIDHKNGNRADNSKANLRECTQTQNNQNSKLRESSKSGYKGVVFDKRSNKWESFITLNRKKKFLGYFDDLELAGFVAEEARNMHYGEFCRHV